MFCSTLSGAGHRKLKKKRAFEGFLAALEKDLHKIPSAQTSSALRAGLGGREKIGWDFAAIDFHGMIGNHTGTYPNNQICSNAGSESLGIGDDDSGACPGDACTQTEAAALAHLVLSLLIGQKDITATARCLHDQD